MAASRHHINLAKTLPVRLQKFFALNTPRLAAISVANERANADSSATPVLLPPDAKVDTQDTVSVGRRQYYNPFLPHKNQKTGKWHPPIYSLRRQAELVKLARDHGVDDLLPFSKKKPEERARKREEEGLRVKGTGVGQKVKGKAAERTMKQKLEKRRQAMLDMPEMVQKWRTRGHGRGWSKWPS